MAGLRFSPAKFRHNGRVAVALIPSLIVLAGFGGKIPVGVMLVGAMVTYILDAMRYREGALGAVWITLGSVNLSLWLSGAIFSSIRPIIMSFLIALCSGVTLFTTGIWATLQFKWVQMQYPVVVLAFEKLLLATSMSVAAMVQSWGLIAAVGAAQAPFYLLPVLCGLYHLLALPLQTSFHVKGARASAIGGKSSKELQVQAAPEGSVAALLLVFLPAALYAVVHFSMLAHWIHLWSLLLLGSAPVLFLAFLQDGLWWLPLSSHARGRMRRTLCLGALAVLLTGVEGRIVFPAFGQYIQLHPPWNYVAVTVALYGAAALAVLHLSGLLEEAAGSGVASSALMISAGLGAYAAGVPLTMMAAPLIAAGGLALYSESGLLRDYALFVGGAMLTGAWFIIHHFWFLDVDMQGMTLRRLSLLLWAAMLPAVALPGMVASKAPSSLVSTTLLVQAGLVAVLEEHLYVGKHDLGGEMYPAVMVVLTSCLGMGIAHKLRGLGRIGPAATWLLHCAYVSKLTMLLLPQAQLPLAIFFLTLAASAPLLLHEAPSDALSLPSRRMPPWQSLAHTLSVVLATLHTRYAVYDMLNLLAGGRPSEGLLAGVLLLIIAAGCAPLVMRHHSLQPGAKRLVVLVGAAGLLLVVLRPPLPLQGGARCPEWLPAFLCLRLWDDRHMPQHELDDVAIWGEFGERREQWPLWMLASSALAALAAATAQGAGSQSATSGLAYAALSGSSVGIYLALEFFPGQLALQVVIVMATLAVAGILVGLQLRGSASPTLLAMLFVIWAAGFPAALFVQVALPLPALPEDARRLFADSSHAVEKQRHDVGRVALLAVYAAEALLVAFAVKLRISAAVSGLGQTMAEGGSTAAAVFRMGNAYADQAASFLGACLPGPMGAALAQMASEGVAWLPTVANLITLACFGLTLLINAQLTEGSDWAIFALSPILLLLSQDPLLLSSLDQPRRYFPLTLAVSMYLVVSSAAQVVHQAWVMPESLVNAAAKSSLSTFKNAALIAVNLPSHLNFNRYLWSRARVSGTAMLLLAPLHLLAALFTDLTTVSILAALGLLMSCVQWVAMRHIRTEGMKLV